MSDAGGVRVYLVISDENRLFEITDSWDRANQAARNINGYAVIVPVVIDWRKS